MKYHNITHDDMKNGDGLRVVLWVSGCSHHCKGCQNPVTWDYDDGLYFGPDAIEEISEELKKDYVSGLTISGGDPFSLKNIGNVSILCKAIKESYPTKTIWVYTGWKWEDLLFSQRQALKYIDVLVDGKFIEELKDVNYPWAGSTNQRVIDVQKSLKEEKVVLYGSDKEGWDSRRVESRQNCGCGE